MEIDSVFKREFKDILAKNRLMPTEKGNEKNVGM